MRGGLLPALLRRSGPVLRSTQGFLILTGQDVKDTPAGSTLSDLLVPIQKSRLPIAFPLVHHYFFFMRRHSPKVKTASALLFVILSFPLHAETPLQDPKIPDGESILYRITKEEKKSETTSYLEQRTSRELDQEVGVYRIFSITPERDTETLLRSRDLLPLRREETVRIGGSTIFQQSILEELTPPGKDSLFVLDMSDLMQQLRGYPFSSPVTLRLIMAGQDPQEDSFSMAIAYGGTEIIEAGGRSFSTHRLSLNIKMSGPMSLIARLIPKTQFWYSSSPPHYLVRFEGGSGFGSSGKQVVELVDYSR